MMFLPAALLFFFMMRPSPRSTLFPYTTLFRSPLFRLSVPVLTSTAPLLLKAKLTSVTPVPADLRKVPVARLLKIRSEEHTSELQSQSNIVCRPALETTTAFPPRQKGEPPAVRV